ncbi:MAG: twin-arginine translocase subunit TatC [Verrucomicrobia bacterium]|nr:twin-arginine translocase subunit TatC [Verrucomicrobiota bacterium]
MADEPEDQHYHSHSHSHSHPQVEEEDGEGGPVKSFLEHLEDLRWTIIKASSALVVGMIVCLLAAKQLIQIMKWPMDKAGLDATKLELLEPIGGFMVSLKIAFYAGLMLGLPFILYFIGEFVIPALKAKEKKYLLTAFTVGSGFFLAGVILCYFVILPVSLEALVKYNKYLGFDTSIWRGEGYFQFAVKFMLGVGLICEVPVLILTLIRLEIITHRMLVKGRSYMFVVNFIICAVLTPADIVTTFLMTLAMQLVYEVCVMVSGYWERQKKSASEMSLATRSPDRSSPTE